MIMVVFSSVQGQLQHTVFTREIMTLVAAVLTVGGFFYGNLSLCHLHEHSDYTYNHCTFVQLSTDT